MNAAPDPQRADLQVERQRLLARLDEVDAQLGIERDPFIPWRRAMPLMRMCDGQEDAAKKAAQRHGMTVGGRLGFRLSYVNIYRCGRGWPPLISDDV